MLSCAKHPSDPEFHPENGFLHRGRRGRQEGTESIRANLWLKLPFGLSCFSCVSWAQLRPQKTLARGQRFCSDPRTLLLQVSEKDITTPQPHTPPALPSARFDTPSIESAEFVACEAIAANASAPEVPDCLQCILVHSRPSQFRANPRDPQAATSQTAHV